MSAHLPTMPPRPSGDITITATHREVMRRLDQGESLTEEHVDTLGALYLHELVEDAPTPALTPLGRRVLDVGGVLTTRQERPRLESRPMPERWLPGFTPGAYRHVLGVHYFDGDTGWLGAHGLTRADERTLVRDLLALIDWLDHEDAVRAQDGGS